MSSAVATIGHLANRATYLRTGFCDVCGAVLSQGAWSTCRAVGIGTWSLRNQLLLIAHRQNLSALFSPEEEIVEINKRSMAAVNESTAHLNSLLAGLGIGQTFRFMAQPHIDGGRLVAILDDWTRSKHPIHIMYPPNRHLNAKLRVFVDWGGRGVCSCWQSMMARDRAGKIRAACLDRRPGRGGRSSLTKKTSIEHQPFFRLNNPFQPVVGRHWPLIGRRFRSQFITFKETIDRLSAP